MFEVEESSGLLLPDGRPVGIANQSGVFSTGEIANDPSVKGLVRALGGWVEQARAHGEKPGMFNRGLYVVPDSPYDQMRTARTAVREDDIVAGVADATENLAFDGGLKWESEEPDEADVFNQLSADLNLDAKIREMWRETFTVDQFVAVKMWDYKTYTVRGTTTSGNARKKRFRVWVPARLVLLRPENVVPIGWGPLREDNLAWQATINEVGMYNSSVVGQEIDPLMTAFFTGVYKPGVDEASELASWNVNLERLLAMNPAWVFRHTSTRPDWSKFPDIRLRSVFALLDLKRQLISSDRSTLIGAANYILLIRKGSEAKPATQEEVTNLRANYQFLAKLPVIISDHRLEIDVIAPKLDFVLKENAYDVLDKRILTRALATFTSTAVRASTTDVFSDVLASGVQSRRHMIKRTLEREVARAVVEHPKNAGLFASKPSLVFTPRNVTIGVNTAVMQAMLALRTQREISRDTVLEYMGLDEATEAQRVEFEADNYDDVFKTQVPYTANGTTAPAAPAAKPAQTDTPNGTPVSPSVNGTRGGGRPVGGGTSSNSPSATAKPRSGNGNPTRGQS